MENISNSDNLFDWIFYINYYKDFKAKGINDKNSALIHWNSIGKYEGRLCNPADLFDWEFYVNYYSDLNINNEDFDKIKEIINNSILDEYPRLSTIEISDFKTKLESFEKGSDEQLDYILEITDNCLNVKDLVLIVDKEIYYDELKLLIKRNKEAVI
jgi:hypothetical protein